MRTYLITGAAGFIGANFLKHMLAVHEDDRFVALDLLFVTPWGVTGIAMSGTILRAANPVEETKKIVNQLKMKNEE